MIKMTRRREEDHHLGKLVLLNIEQNKVLFSNNYNNIVFLTKGTGLHNTAQYHHK